MIRISELDDMTLLDMRTNCMYHQQNIRNKPAQYNALDLKEVAKDLNEIEREIESRLPVSFKWDIEKIQLGLTEPQHRVGEGHWYRHKDISLLRLQIVNEYDYNGPLWSARVFIGRVYACRFIIKTSTLLEHFTRCDS